MRKSLVVGILRETKMFEHRTPLVPNDVKRLIKRGIRVEVESSTNRIFNDTEYKQAGARVVEKSVEATLMVGIKEPRVHDLHSHKIYMVFSHTAKGQPHNMPLLNACLRKQITMIDYEKIVDAYGNRLVYFGRFAGICGTVDSLHNLGRKLKWKGIDNPFSMIRPAYEYESLAEMKDRLADVNQQIRQRGMAKEITPFIIGITGHGNVSRGVQEIIDMFKPMEVHPGNMAEFMELKKRQCNRIYKIVFLREEKFRSKSGRKFYFEEYLKSPKKFESNMDAFLPFINMLIHTSYWDSKFPRLVTEKMIKHLAAKGAMRIEFIGDLSCDIRGSIELTHKTTSPDNPVFTYNPVTGIIKDGYKSEGITVLAIDNLPAEMPRDSSEDFSGLIRDYVYQIAAHGINDITRHMAIPSEIRNAVVTQKGRLTKNSSYLRAHISIKGK
jgi:alpha-aminoadipic semialdehyde synthase